MPAKLTAATRPANEPVSGSAGAGRVWTVVGGGIAVGRRIERGKPDYCQGRKSTPGEESPQPNETHVCLRLDRISPIRQRLVVGASGEA